MKFANDIEEMVYLGFQEIDGASYQEKIRYFERKKPAIAQLSYQLRLEMSLEYVVALFEVGEYKQYLKHVDQLLAKVMDDNIYSVDGDDIYQELLYRKAASLHNVLDYEGANHILTELCKIDPDNEVYNRTFIKNNADNLRHTGQKVRGIIIALFILAGLIIAVELLIIRPFYEEQVAATELLRNGLFLTALGGIIFYELKIRFFSWRKHKNLLKS